MTSCAGNLDDNYENGRKFKKSRINLCNGKKISIKGGQAYEKTSGDKADRSVNYGSGNDKMTAVPFGGAAYGNEVPRGGIVNTEDTETLTASDSNSEHKKNSDSNADAKIEMEAAKRGADCALFDAETIITGSGKENDPYVIKSPEDWVKVMTMGNEI